MTARREPRDREGISLDGDPAERHRWSAPSTPTHEPRPESGVEVFRQVPLDLIDPSGPTGRRISIQPTKFERLACSIREDGVREPLEVRSSEKGRMELLHGEVRFCVLRYLNRAVAPCRILRISDREALERKLRADRNERIKRWVIDGAWLLVREMELLRADGIYPSYTLLCDRTGSANGTISYRKVIGEAIPRELFGEACAEAGVSEREAAPLAKDALLPIAKLKNVEERKLYLRRAMEILVDQGKSAATAWVKECLVPDNDGSIRVEVGGVTITLPEGILDLDDAMRRELVSQLCDELSVPAPVHRVNAAPLQVMHQLGDPDGLAF